ncbi:NAD(P)H-binding protein [Paenibacillus roseipurpureus]|uniref:NAD(P)H-binding protein n=1 Tax=Paenibacillus roseopurpureus TaxID=2918901 RepID=A0AA96RLA2_9BACL|nr:NAD(P)H-binding protein [Paenibacillus sp. MBLB1832]WNR45184.1 NAD(P)H-binding protein [Paenibacillus sp. MBLB1832]
MKAKVAIVAGGTGLVGRELLKQLLADESYVRVIALVRTKMNMDRLPGANKIEQRVIDFANLSDAVDLAEVAQAHVFCTLGTTIKKAGSQRQFRKVDLEYPLQLGKLASLGDADAFAIVTAMGANRDSSFFYNKVKGEVEDGLRALQLRSLHILRPSLILGDRGEFRLAERWGSVLAQAIAPLMVGKLRTYRPIHASTIATGLIRAVKSGKAGVQVLTSGQITALAGK